jgi:hypothetical protein
LRNLRWISGENTIGNFTLCLANSVYSIVRTFAAAPMKIWVAGDCLILKSDDLRQQSGSRRIANNFRFLP